MRVTPKINDNPAATKNNDDAPAKPFNSWTTKPEKLIPIPQNKQALSVAGVGVGAQSGL